MSNWKNIFKGWAGVPVLILLALLVIWLINSLFPFLTNRFESWQARRAYEKLSEPYYKDTYGGKTPEETYDMFIAALKKGDTDLAAKYFVIEKQDDWKETLTEYKNSGSLNNFAGELENTKKVWIKSEKSTLELVSFVYTNTIKEDKEVEFEGEKLVIPAGNYRNESIFTKYPTGIWKIESL